MQFVKGLGSFFALDIGTNAIRVVQLGKSGTGWALEHYAYVPIDQRTSSADSGEAKRKLGESILTAVGQSGARTRNVVVGLPSNKTFTTVIDVPESSEAELKATMKYQADQYIPMSVDDAKYDWALLGPSLHAQGQQEVLLTSVAKEYSEQRLELVEGLGLNVIAAEPDPIAMVRALVPAGNQAALLLLDMGELSTDIAVVYGDTPRLIRTVPVGVSSLVKAATQNLNVQEDQARQFILKFGLAPDKLDGQVLHAVEGTLANFVAEVTKTIKFFQTRYASVAVGGGIVAGFAASVPMLSNYIGEKTGLQTQPANPWNGITMSQDAQTKLAPVAHEFSTVIGLAKRRGDS